MNQRLNVVFVVACVFAQALCQWLQFNGKVYYFSHHDDVTRSYDAANSRCSWRHGGAQLVSINSEAENRFLAVSSGSEHQFWIGLTCDSGTCTLSDLRWEDRSRVTFNNGPDQMTEGNAAVLATNGGWPQLPVDEAHYYICERGDTCSSSPCLNGGTCQLNSATGNWMCECPDGTGGDNCACDGSLCQNDRPCIDGADNFTCNCGSRFTGPHCQTDVDECQTRPGLCNNGQCSNTHGLYACTCNPGYTGSHCGQDIDECASNPCLNGFNCTNFNGGYNCICAGGYDVNSDCTNHSESSDDDTSSDHDETSSDDDKSSDDFPVNLASIAMMAAIAIMLIMLIVAVALAHKWKKQLNAYKRRETYEHRKRGGTDPGQSGAIDHDTYSMPVFDNVYVNAGCHQNNAPTYDSLPN